MGRAEALLKVVGSRPENFIDNFFTLIPNGTPAEFNRIQDLKVMKRQDQQAVMDNYNKRIGRLAGVPTPFPSAARPGPAVSTPVRSPSPATAPSHAGPAAAATPDLVSRFRFGSSTAQGARAAAGASAAAAGQKMRETMAGSLAAMKNLNLGFARRQDNK
eukprot:jgi/Botrbrau1/21658/Bobra.43_1s0058.1